MDKNYQELDKHKKDTETVKPISKIIDPKLSGEGFKEDKLGTHTDESIYTKDVSKTSFLKKRSKKPLKWSENDTHTFYRCLEVFGMDFSMIAEVLSHKTPRQILRKFKKERKKDPGKIDIALTHHKSNFVERDIRAKSFLDTVFKLTSNSEASDNDHSDDSLEKAVIKKLKLIGEVPEKYLEEPIESLDYYLNQIDLGFSDDKCI